MQRWEIIVIILTITFVFLVFFFHFYTKKSRKGGCSHSCDCCGSKNCSSCPACQMYKDLKKEFNK